MTRVAMATAILSAIALSARAQPPRVNPAVSTAPAVTLSGRVVADETGDAIANARVALTGSTQSGPALTNRDGRFELSAPPGRYTIAVSKTGYGRRDVTATEQPIEIRLLRGVSISGRVTDGRADPIVGARVVAETTAKTATGFAAAAATDTDDRGEYRMGSLAADTFKVAVMTRGEPTRQELPGGGSTITNSVVKTYYPDAVTIREAGAPVASNSPDAAEALRLEPGEDRLSIDFVVPAGQPGLLQMMMMMSPLGLAPTSTQTVRPAGIVRGRVVATDGRAVPRAQVRLMPALPPTRAPGANALPRPVQPTVVTADDDGRFEFVELAAGRSASRRSRRATPRRANRCRSVRLSRCPALPSIWPTARRANAPT